MRAFKAWLTDDVRLDSTRPEQSRNRKALDFWWQDRNEERWPVRWRRVERAHRLKSNSPPYRPTVNTKVWFDPQAGRVVADDGPGHVRIPACDAGGQASAQRREEGYQQQYQQVMRELGAEAEGLQLTCSPSGKTQRENSDMGRLSDKVRTNVVSASRQVHQARERGQAPASKVGSSPAEVDPLTSVALTRAWTRQERPPQAAADSTDVRRPLRCWC
ncbi:hypothetical protein D9Q98_002646 [Chlorella vulgaris]|uniref:Uncharacterized protein n=1 Tax=Chlorella vulgaris TaxID=3077 RepID=A0A9D4TTT0_CHLVU|nr:hypothetical protein D9Q98_002646 [Chlorella vulgaris]